MSQKSKGKLTNNIKHQNQTKFTVILLVINIAIVDGLVVDPRSIADMVSAVIAVFPVAV